MLIKVFQQQSSLLLLIDNSLHYFDIIRISACPAEHYKLPLVFGNDCVDAVDVCSVFHLIRTPRSASLRGGP